MLNCMVHKLKRYLICHVSEIMEFELHVQQIRLGLGFLQSFSTSVLGLARFGNSFPYGLHLWFPSKHFAVQLALVQKVAISIVCEPNLRLRRGTAIVAHVPAHLVYLRPMLGGSGYKLMVDGLIYMTIYTKLHAVGTSGYIYIYT